VHRAKDMPLVHPNEMDGQQGKNGTEKLFSQKSQSRNIHLCFDAKNGTIMKRGVCLCTSEPRKRIEKLLNLIFSIMTFSQTGITVCIFMGSFHSFLLTIFKLHVRCFV